MRDFERVFKEKFIEFSNEYEFKDLKNRRGKLYNAIISTISECIKKSMVGDSLVLINHKFTKLSLKENKPKMLIFAGTYIYKGNKVILVESKETIGTYIYDNPNIVRQLNNMRIGTVFQLEKHSEGVNMLLPYDDVRIGLFDEI